MNHEKKYFNERGEEVDREKIEVVVKSRPSLLGKLFLICFSVLFLMGVFIGLASFVVFYVIYFVGKIIANFDY